MNDRNQILVTIGIPTFNRADAFLRNALTSATSQTYRNIEIIVADNCSADDTEDLVRSIGDSRIRYFKHPTNIGANNNFNFCLEKANGDYFLLLHDDDLIDDDFIETCIKALNGEEVGIIRTGTRLIDANGGVLKEKINNVNGSSMEEFCFDWFKNKTSLYLCSTLFNTEGLRKIGGFKSKTNLFQDVVAQIKLIKKNGKLDIKPAKASFRKHPGEMTFSRTVKEWCDDSMYLLDLICQLSDSEKERLRSEGKKFFCRLNYKRASHIRSLAHRTVTYMSIYSTFDYCYSPVHFAYEKRKAGAAPTEPEAVLSGDIKNIVR